MYTYPCTDPAHGDTAISVPWIAHQDGTDLGSHGRIAADTQDPYTTNTPANTPNNIYIQTDADPYYSPLTADGCRIHRYPNL